MSALHAWLAAAAQRGADLIHQDGEEQVERGVSMHDGSVEDLRASIAATEARADRDARALLLLPEVAAAAHVALGCVDALIANSEGVAGLHLNGDVAAWGELTAGGQYEDWLRDLEGLRSILASLSAVASADGAGEAKRG